MKEFRAECFLRARGHFAREWAEERVLRWKGEDRRRRRPRARGTGDFDDYRYR